MSERAILSAWTAAIAASWVYYFAVYLQAPSTWRWLALPVAAALGALTWWRYSGGHRTETAFAEEVPALHRRIITLGMTIAGLIGGFILPMDLGAGDTPLALELALALTLAATCGWIAWNHPTLFYKNRRF